jgi:TRAP-type C4-dicarboxylate transport system permease small subunit
MNLSTSSNGVLTRVFARVLQILSSLGTAWIFLLMLVITVDVVGRTAFTSPLPGVPELVSISIVGIVFLSLPQALRAGRITRVESLSDYISRKLPRVGHGLMAFYSALGIALFAALFVASRPMFMKAWVNNDYVGVEGYITYPVWPVRLIILVGCVGCILQYALMAIDHLRQAAGHSGAPSTSKDPQ